jgi:hypothetical protein
MGSLAQYTQLVADLERRIDEAAQRLPEDD